MRNAKGHKQPRTPRRAAQFWAPLNSWWRGYLAEHNRRPQTSELQDWYNTHSDAAWPVGKPTWKEARIHAKCLRSTEQVKQYFREYRARGKANAAPSSGGGGDSSRGLSEARQPSGDVGNDYVAGVPLSMPSAGGLLMAGSQVQGPPDTLDLLVASHNARINELNGTLASLGTLGSPFAAQTLPSSTFFGAARSSLPPPMWQHGKAPSSERFSAARTSILDGLGAALSDRNISFGTGALGASMSFHPARVDKAPNPFTAHGSLMRERVSCPTPPGSDLAGTWSESGQRPSSNPLAYPGRQRRVTSEQSHLAVGMVDVAGPAGAGIRFSRSFTLQPTQGGGGRLLPGGDWSGSGVLGELHGGERAEGVDAATLQNLERKELLRMVAQDALGSDSKRSSGGIGSGMQAGGSSMAPIMQSTLAAARGMRRMGPDSGHSGSGQPETDFNELWSLAEDEPSGAAGGHGNGSGGYSAYAMHHQQQPGHPGAFMQDGSMSQQNLLAGGAGTLPDRASACSDPGPAQPPYPRSVSYPSVSPRTSCLSSDGPATNTAAEHHALLTGYQRNATANRGPLGIASAVAAAAAAAAAANRRLSDSNSGDLPAPLPGRSSLPSTLGQRGEYTRPLVLSDLTGGAEQLGAWSNAQELQVQGLRVNGARLALGGMVKEEIEQRNDGHAQRAWPAAGRPPVAPRNEDGSLGRWGGGGMEWDRAGM